MPCTVDSAKCCHWVHFFPLLVSFPFWFFLNCLLDVWCHVKKKKINKPKHYSSKFNIAYLPGTGLRESEKHHVKTVLSSHLERCLGWKGLAQQDFDTSTCKWDSPCRTKLGVRAYCDIVGKWFSNKLRWSCWEYKDGTECKKITTSQSLEVCWKVKGRTRGLSPVKTCLATENKWPQFLPRHCSLCKQHTEFRLFFSSLEERGKDVDHFE